MIAAVPEEDRALRATAFYAGLRSGELQALRVESIELFPEGRWGLIHVDQGWNKLAGAQETKSNAGKRIVPVCEQLYSVLADHVPTHQAEERAGLRPHRDAAVQLQRRPKSRRAGVQG